MVLFPRAVARVDLALNVETADMLAPATENRTNHTFYANTRSDARSLVRLNFSPQLLHCNVLPVLHAFSWSFTCPTRAPATCSPRNPSRWVIPTRWQIRFLMPSLIHCSRWILTLAWRAKHL